MTCSYFISKNTVFASDISWKSWNIHAIPKINRAALIKTLHIVHSPTFIAYQQNTTTFSDITSPRKMEIIHPPEYIPPIRSTRPSHNLKSRRLGPLGTAGNATLLKWRIWSEKTVGFVISIDSGGVVTITYSNAAARCSQKAEFDLYEWPGGRGWKGYVPVDFYKLLKKPEWLRGLGGWLQIRVVSRRWRCGHFFIWNVTCRLIAPRTFSVERRLSCRIQYDSSVWMELKN